ncbi:cholinephosphotransferase 1-like [Anastrepha ludens]|uniref:cholinephosphotransferase 1-like n=1 Tax=Anastrepha ludens TaxID=28586 RepID=UPI0023AED9BC|nr:cholinephosphotransferase 1-like [Anastrepha ludens]
MFCSVQRYLPLSNVIFVFFPSIKLIALHKGTSVLSPSIPLTLVILPALIIAQKSPQNIFTDHSSLYILAFGMVAAKVTNKLVIAHMTKAEMEYLDWSQLGPALLFFNPYFNCVLPEIWLLWFTFVWGAHAIT